MEFTVLTADGGFEHTIGLMVQRGVKSESRNGPVLMLPEPVQVQVRHPLLPSISPVRDANPFFHLGEALLMLAGERRVGPYAELIDQMREYSDDGELFHANYGWRLRKHFGVDQLALAGDRLREDPETRRAFAVVADPREDASYSGRDMPCNLDITFWRSPISGCLDFRVTNRSNDAMWGLWGANAVHWPTFAEYVAARAGLQLGRWWHCTSNLHLYEAHQQLIAKRIEKHSAWSCKTEGWEAGPLPVKRAPLVKQWRSFDDELALFLAEMEPKRHWENTFLPLVAEPMREAMRLHKEGATASAIERTEWIVDDGWRRAAKQWLQRRLRPEVA